MLTANVACEFPDVFTELPVNARAEALRMRHYGMERVFSIIEKKLTKESFAEAETYFEEQSQGNKAWFHLLMAMYLTRVADLFIPYLSSPGSEPNRSERTIRMQKNNGWVGTLILHHLMLAMVRLDPDYVDNLPRAVQGLDLDVRHWSVCCSGAMTALRVASLFSKSGFHVFFPSPEEDLFDKIDLFLVSKKGPLSICVQVKSDSTVHIVHLSHLKEKDWPKFSGYQKKFFDGVRAYGGTDWQAVECNVYWTAFERGSLIPKDSIDMQRRVDLFVKSLTAKK